MDKILREKTLKSLAQSSHGDALLDWWEEHIDKLTDATTYSIDNFEVEGKSSLKAALVLKKMVRALNLKKEKKQPKELNNYI